jgi:hypothetical protein
MSRSKSPSLSPASDLECCDPSVYIFAEPRREDAAHICHSTPATPAFITEVDTFHELNLDITGCDPLIDSPLDILPGGIYLTKDYIVPAIGQDTPFNDKLMRLGMRVGNTWFTFNDMFNSTTRAEVKMEYFPGQNSIRIYGTAVGRIHTGSCLLDQSITGLGIDLYNIEISIKDGIIPINSAGADKASFIVRNPNISLVLGHVSLASCSSRFDSSCPHFNFSVVPLTSLVTIPDIMPTVEILSSGDAESIPPSMIMGINFPFAFPGSHSAIIAIKIDGCSDLVSNPLETAACVPFFEPESPSCSGHGLVMFDIQSICNGCDPIPEPTPGICPHHNVMHSRRQEEDEEEEQEKEKDINWVSKKTKDGSGVDSDLDSNEKSSDNNYSISKVTLFASLISCFLITAIIFGAVFYVRSDKKSKSQTKEVSFSRRKKDHQSDYYSEVESNVIDEDQDEKSINTNL